MKNYILLGVFIFFTTYIYSRNISLVLNNKPNANIVVPDKSNKHLNIVAKELENYIFSSTKAKLKILNFIIPSQNNIIIATRYQDVKYNYDLLDDDGFLIRTNRNYIIISGKTDWGTEYGVYEFLEKFVGVRWLMPTELWTEVPTKSTLSVGEIDIVDSPRFLSRSFFPINMGNKDEFLGKWGKYNRLRNRVEFHHNLKKIFNSEDIVKNNPEFLPMVNSKRYIPKNRYDRNWQPNFKAKGVDTYAANKIIKYFKQHPNETSISLGVNDSGNFDRSNSDGSKNYTGRENYSNAYYSWVNNTVKIVNKCIFNKKFGLLAYSRVAEPPTFKLEDNVIPFITYERLMWLDPVLKHKSIAVTRKWKNITNELGWYDYVYGGPYIVPRIYFKHYQEYLKIASSFNVKYYVAEYYPNWLEGPKGWIMSKLLWDPNQNLDHLLDDWYISAVGARSAPYLRKFYELWEDVWTNEIPKSSWWKRKGGTYLFFNNQSYVNDISYDRVLEADTLLNLAYKYANSKNHKNRIIDLLDMWEFSKMNYLYFRQKHNILRMNKGQKVVSSRKVTKKQIKSTIEKLDNHPLHNTIMHIYKKPNRVKY